MHQYNAGEHSVAQVVWRAVGLLRGDEALRDQREVTS